MMCATYELTAGSRPSADRVPCRHHVPGDEEAETDTLPDARAHLCMRAPSEAVEENRERLSAIHREVSRLDAVLHGLDTRVIQAPISML
jgi:hypothetical protein